MNELHADFRNLFIGIDQKIPLLDGSVRLYTNFDNAATTPSFRAVNDAVNKMLPYYAGVHRGTGFKSLLSTFVFDTCREIVSRFVSADHNYHVVIFSRHTTDAINKVCHHLDLQPDEKVLTTVMEHHSNLLPWIQRGQVDVFNTTDEHGIADFQSLEKKLEQHRGKVRLVAITGTSNVTGCIPPIYEIARTAHAYDAMVLVDAAQLAAHRPIIMGSQGKPESIDFVAFSAHKMYAPFGSGALIGPRDFFRKHPPDIVGGGAVELVTLDEIFWTEPPEKEEAGTPNLLGIVALAAAIKTLMTVSFDSIIRHEHLLTQRLLEGLHKVPHIKIYGYPDFCPAERRSAVVPIIADNIDHSLLAAILGYEWGIGVRHGCFCAHPYILHLFHIDDKALQAYKKQIALGDHRNLPGFVRISLALYNTIEEIDYFIEAMNSIVTKGPSANYIEDPRTGEYHPQGFSYNFPDYSPV